MLILRSILRRLSGNRWLYIIAINCAASATVAMLRWLNQPQSDYSHIFGFALLGLLYSNSIGLLVAIGVDYLLARLSRFPLLVQPLFLILVVFVQTTAGCLLASAIAVFALLIPNASVWQAFYSVLPFALVLSFTFSGVGILYSLLYTRMENAMLQLQTKELERERASKLAAEARLATLEARMHPHFIFNTLNTIAALICEDPVQAERTVEQLASLLRAMLYSDRSGTIALRDEFEVVANYLAIEAVRYGDRFCYQINLPAGLEETRVPPLAVQTLVENSIKHVVAHAAERCEICVAAHTSGESVEINVADSGGGFPTASIIAGHGLDSLRDRLKILFDERASLKFKSDGNGRAVVAILLPRSNAE